ncbi:hypothetical protein BT69DRAFT_1015580 [Atractiella rhizophila]|nr:hypothetical protein BT69DRAFT_1015580 [Atractiella rhizophila]
MEVKDNVFSISVTVYLNPAYWTPYVPPSMTKTNILRFLFTQRPLTVIEEEELSTVNFYKHLRGGRRVRLSPPAQSVKGKERAIEPNEDPPILEPPGLNARLMPFQSRTLRWMKAREGEEERKQDAELWWEETQPNFNFDSAPEGKVWINWMRGVVEWGEKPTLEPSKGGAGLLAEEMGLGKTVISLGLILENQEPDRNDQETYWDDELKADIQPSGLTLIVCPGTIVSQWENEIRKHADGLRVYRYEGVNKLKKYRGTWDAQAFANDYDIVLTTFDLLRKEVDVARPPVDRNTRSRQCDNPRYERSLFIRLDFLRVILDEAQLLQNPMSHVSETVSCIRRKHSWAVTSTPIKTALEDLASTLKFLRIGSQTSGVHWPNLIRPCCRPTWGRLWDRVAVRTTKAMVDNEMTLPTQKRYLCPIRFSKVERYTYDELYSEALMSLGLSKDGVPAEEDWVPNRAALAYHLSALRKVCCHPQVVDQNKLGSSVLKTIDEILHFMRHQNLASVFQESRALGAAECKRAHLVMFDAENCTRFEEALEILKTVIARLDPLLDEIKAELGPISDELQTARAEKASIEESGSEPSDEGPAQNAKAAKEMGLETLDEKVERLTQRHTSMKQHSRELLLVLHSTHFLSGNCYFSLGKFPTEERDSYTDAERIRATLLSGERMVADQAGQRLRVDLQRRDISKDSLRFQLSQVKGGLLTNMNIKETNETIKDLNSMGKVIWKWREEIIKLLQVPVSADDGQDASGDEYQKGIEVQERCDVYLSAYSELLLDWRELITGEKVLSKGKRPRYKKKVVPTLEKGYPAAEVLAYELNEECCSVKPEEFINLRDNYTKLNHIANGLNLKKDHPEQSIIKAQKVFLKEQRDEGQKVIAKLLNEANVEFRRVFNTRAEYFKALQSLSDDVSDPVLTHRSKPLLTQIADAARESALSQEKLQEKLSKKRYLDFLQKQSKEVTQDERQCVICAGTFKHGVITNCGHLCCLKCFENWRLRSRRCSICQSELPPGSWQEVDFVEKGGLEHVPEKWTKGSAFEAPSSLNMVDPALMKSISLFDFSKGPEELQLNPFGRQTQRQVLSSKLDLISKHIRYLRQRDPTSKAVVFSCWKESLDLLMSSFNRNGIRFVRLEGTTAAQKQAAVTKFAEDDSIAVFVLHTRSQSAGLTLTCANYLFLLEPLLHPSFELQACARIHRIGQTRQTTVFQYFVEGTVEERIVHHAARARTSLFLTSEAAPPAEKESEDAYAPTSPSRRTKKVVEEGDEMSSLEQLQECLFDKNVFLGLQRFLLGEEANIVGGISADDDSTMVEAEGVDADAGSGMMVDESSDDELNRLELEM